MGSDSTPPKILSDDGVRMQVCGINRGVVSAHMHATARTQKILTSMSSTGECRQQKHVHHAPSTNTVCDYLHGLIKKKQQQQTNKAKKQNNKKNKKNNNNNNGYIRQNLTPNGEAQRYNWERRRSHWYDPIGQNGDGFPFSPQMMKPRDIAGNAEEVIGMTRTGTDSPSHPKW